MSEASSISVHALKRFMERAKGIDIVGIEAELGTIVAEAKAAGLSDFHRDGLRYIIRDGVLVTVSPSVSRARLRQVQRARQRLAFAEARICR